MADPAGVHTEKARGALRCISKHLVMADTELKIADGREAPSTLLPCYFFKRYEQTFLSFLMRLPI